MMTPRDIFDGISGAVRDALRLPSGRAAKPKRGERVRSIRRGKSWRRVVEDPTAAPSLLIALIAGFAATLIVMSAHRTPQPIEGRVVDTTRLARIEFTLIDEEGTEAAREYAASRAPLGLRLESEIFNTWRESLLALPIETTTPASEETGELASGPLIKFFEDGAPTEAWRAGVDRTLAKASEVPILSQADASTLSGSQGDELVLYGAGDTPRRVRATIAVLATDERAASILRDAAAASGLPVAAQERIAQTLAANVRPTYTFDAALTQSLRESASNAVPPDQVTFRPGDVLARRRDVMTDPQAAAIRAEHDAYMSQQPVWRPWSERSALAGLVLCVIAVMGGYLRVFDPTLLARPKRVLAVAMICVGGMAIAIAGVRAEPELAWPLAVGPLILMGMILLVLHDARFALLSTAGFAGLAAMALGARPGMVITVLAGVCAAAWWLRDISSRSDVVRAAMFAGVASASATLLVGLLERPAVWGVASELLVESLLGGLAAFGAGAVTLVFLPTIERTADIVTGMTLSEWRDPRQPLLRELQQRAPGTYNHSLNVATLAEAAADAIGADSLHVYVGALYHDCGKMNKPLYFIENQSGGPNKHDKLSPAMSLLVIVGHVKDGLELARRYNLPSSLHHYVESHHGTTLVEYFYDQARRQADLDDSDDGPDEIEYRYPGPKPRTREAAIMMLCDCVESATRTLSDPTPSRIRTLVHQMAMKRLGDGQFDNAGITLAELHKVEESIAATLSAIYHGRIAYPGQRDEKKPEAESPEPETSAI